MLKSIIKSQHIIGTIAIGDVKGTLSCPDLTTLAENSWEELRNLKITQLHWFIIYSLGFTLSDGQTCKAGKHDFQNSHFFDPTKKITRIECIIPEDEYWIFQIHFYHHQERLVALGKGLNENDIFKDYGERVEVFEIGDDEQLIGCDLDYCKNFFMGIKWIKMRLY